MEAVVIRLSDLPLGQKAIILGYDLGNRDYKMKLLSLGLTRGTEIKIIRQTMFGGLMIVELRGFRLSLRPSEASIIKVKPLAG